MHSRAFRITALALAVALIGATLAVLWHTRARTTSFYTDGHSIRQPVAAAPVRDILWQPAAPLVPESPDAGPINSADQEYEPRYTEDGQTLFFVRGKAGQSGRGGDIYVSHRRRERWSAPQPLATINSPADDLGPEPSADGRLLFFYSDRAGGLGGYDLWVSVRAVDAGDDPAQGWGSPVNLGATVNSPFNDYGPAVTPDGSTLYFSSNRPRPGDPAPDPAAWPATLREDLTKHTYDLYSAPLTASPSPDAPPFPPSASPVARLNTTYNEGTPAVSPFGDFLYFSSDRPGGRGSFDLYRARLRPGSPEPDEPENVGPAINTAAAELDPALSLGGYALTFSTNRVLPDSPAASAPSAAGEPPDYNLFRSYSREIYRDGTTVRASMDWAAVVPWLGLLALVLLLLSLLHLLKRFTQSSRYRQLSLLAKCLLASLLVHAVLLLLFTFWYVGGALEGVLRGGGGGGRATRIAITLPAGGGGIASQLRADLTSSPITTAAVPPVPRFAESPAPVAVEAAHFDAPLVRATTLTRALDAPAASDAPAPDQPTPRLLTRAPEGTTPESIDLNTPRPESPTAGAEPAVVTGQALAHAPADRTPLVAPPSASAPQAHSFAPSARADQPAPARCVADAAPTGAPDARPPTSRPLDAPRTPDVAQLALGIDIAVPRPAAGATTTSAEPSPSVAAASPASVRPALTASPGSTAESAPQVSLPVSGATSAAAGSNPTSLVAAPGYQMADAHPGAAPPSRAPAPPGLGLPALAAADLATPSAQASPASAAPDEAQPGIAAAAPASGAGRAQVPLPATGAQNTAAVSLAPATGPAPASPKGSLADVSSSAPADARPGPIPTAGVGSPRIPALGALNTPDLPLPSVGSPAQVAGAEDQSPTPSSPGAATASRSAFPSPPAPGNSPLSRTATLDPRRSAPGAAGAGSLADPAARPADAPAARSASRGDQGPPASVASPAPLALDLPIPSGAAPEDNPYRQRAPDIRPALVERLGGSPETERAVTLALAWLARHQSDDGHWDGHGFDDRCGQCDGQAPRNINSNAALTGLATLCFLGADHTHAKDGPYKDNVRRAIEWLLRRQSETGDLRSGETMYSQGIATIALAEAYGMTHDPALKLPIERAVAFIVDARDSSNGQSAAPGRRGEADRDRSGGWRYTPHQAGDTSVLGWQVMALASAIRAGIDVPHQPLDAAASWLEQVSLRAKPGLYAYQPGQVPSPSMTAEGLFVQQLLTIAGVHTPGHDDPGTTAAVEFISKNPPSWASRPGRGLSGAGGAPTYYWYYATLALFQHQGEAWDKWNDALKRELLAHQRAEADNPAAAGSWDPVDKYSRVGGRIYQTAICTLSLEVYYRYLPMYQSVAAKPPVPDARP
jgi:hypothetical protein